MSELSMELRRLDRPTMAPSTRSVALRAADALEAAERRAEEAEAQMGIIKLTHVPEDVGCGHKPLVSALEMENARLREELWEQWLDNHAEHCSNEWPHEAGKTCCWPLPAVLGEAE